MSTHLLLYYTHEKSFLEGMVANHPNFFKDISLKKTNPSTNGKEQRKLVSSREDECPSYMCLLVHSILVEIFLE